MIKRTKEILMEIIVFLIITIVIGLAGHIETHYTRKDCVVVEVEQGLMTVLDTTGNEWCYYMDSDALSTGTKVDLKMFTNYTDNAIEDDEIVKVIVR
jgi:hypothetical protein